MSSMNMLKPYHACFLLFDIRIRPACLNLTRSVKALACKIEQIILDKVIDFLQFHSVYFYDC